MSGLYYLNVTVHVLDFVLGAAATQQMPSSAEVFRSRRWAAWLAQINAVIGVVLVIAAVRLGRGA